MKRRTWAVLALCGCVHAEIVQRPDEPFHEGIVKYLDEGTDTVRENMRNDAYLRMQEVCGGGTYVLISESNHLDAEVTPGEAPVPGGWHYLKFKCLSDDHHGELLPCCYNASLKCGDPSCTCEPHVCGSE
jgi:hypothetical protein